MSSVEFNRAYFDPPAPKVAKSSLKGDAADEKPIYVYTDPIVLAVNVALATGRPLLVAGPPGTGKSTLARHIAHVKKWRYLKRVVTSKTQVDDLLAGFDALRRLNDAQLQTLELLPDAGYVEPGVLWWAFDPASARWRGIDPHELEPAVRARFPEAEYTVEGSGADAVVVLDEIDKADPDVPNDLLEPLDLKRFAVKHLREPVSAQGEVFIVITTNGERELPPAFIRRCVVLNLEPMNEDRLVQIAETHYGRDTSGQDIYRRLAQWLVQLRDEARRRGVRQPGTAEYLDTVQACRKLVEKGNLEEVWQKVARVAMWKEAAEMPVLAQAPAEMVPV